MKKSLALVLALVLVLSLVPTAFAKEEVESPRSPITGVVEYETIAPNTASCTGDSVRVRTSIWGSVIGRLYVGDPIVVLAFEGDWAKVSYNNQEAYVFASYLKLPADHTVPTLPVVYGEVAPRREREVKEAHEGEFLVLKQRQSLAE